MTPVATAPRGAKCSSRRHGFRAARGIGHVTSAPFHDGARRVDDRDQNGGMATAARA